MSGSQVIPSISDPALAAPASEAEVRETLAGLRRLIASDSLTSEQARWLSAWAASQFWAHYLTDGSYLSEAITLLSEIATQDDPTLAQPGQEGLFSFLVERLSDSFNPDYCPVYDRIFVQVVEWCRRLPAGARLDAELRRFGLDTAQHLLERKRRLATVSYTPITEPSRVKKVILLSRVTLGAEVAVTGTLIARAKHAFRDARCVLLAARTMRQVFAEDPRIDIHEVRYDRSGGLIERLKSWLDIVQAVRSEIEGLGTGEYLVLDPDSRLTQLGIFPVLQDESRYLFFESRGYGQDGSDCMGALTNQWANEMFGGEGTVYPEISPPAEDWAFARTLRARLQAAGVSHLVMVSFGVGGNLLKRLPDPFEQELVSRLIESGSLVLLAKGVDDEEVTRANQLLAHVASQGKRAKEIDSRQSRQVPDAEDLGCDLLAWEGSVGTYCALIGTSDEYIGYDSGGQHIAAALGTPTVDIFVHSPYPRFMERWRPYGPGKVHVVAATDPHGTKPGDPRVALARVMACHTENKSALGTGKP